MLLLCTPQNGALHYVSVNMVLKNDFLEETAKVPAHPPGIPTTWVLQEEERVIPSGNGLPSRSAQITMHPPSCLISNSRTIYHPGAAGDGMRVRS